MSEQGRPGRYQRSFGGLVGAMIIIVAVVIAFVVYRGLFSNDPEVQRPDAIEYLDGVASLQSVGLTIVYPATLPEGWTVTDLRPDLGDRPSFDLNLYTDDDEFVGIRQADADVDDLVSQYIDDNATDAAPLSVEAPLGDAWAGWEDDGGDHGFSTTLGDQSVLVYGDVPVADLELLIPLLTTDAVPTE